MCHTTYISTDTKIPVTQWNEEGIFKITILSEDAELVKLKPKLTKVYIYHLGSYEGCSCGFQRDDDVFEELDETIDIEGIDYEKVKKQNEIKIKSINKLIKLIKSSVKHDDIEFYSCWFDEIEQPIKEVIKININSINIQTNYFGIIERRKVIFINH